MAETRQFCTFHVDGHFFGMDVLKVQEVIRQQPMTRVPLAAFVVRGLINLRGQIVTAIDLRRRLELKDRDPGHPPVNVVVQTGDGAVSLLVDDIGDVIAVDESSFELPPATLQSSARDLIAGVYKLEDRLLMILDADRTVNVVSENRDPPRSEA